jgi:hypothetical protein
MAKKNFDDFIKAAGKKPKPTPEEVEAMAKQLHQANRVEPPNIAVPLAPSTAEPIARPKQEPAAKTAAAKKPRREKGASSTAKATKKEPVVEPPADAPKEKVRITIDLAKDLYKRMKLAVVQNETEISAYVRQLIETDLAKK